MWRIYWEMLMINVWEEMESCKHFLTETEIENGRHRVFNFDMSSFDYSLLNDKQDYVLKNWKVLQKLTLHLDSFWKILTMESVGIFTLTRTILLWRDLKVSVHKLTWLIWQTECRKWIFLIFVPRNSQYKVEILQTYKFENFCFLTQRCTHGL